jgi:hypothetical protein
MFRHIHLGVGEIVGLIGPYFHGVQDDGTPMHLPAQIITFVEFSKFGIGLLDNLPFVFGSNPSSFYAMIETIE